MTGFFRRERQGLIVLAALACLVSVPLFFGGGESRDYAPVATDPDGARIDINTADKETLMELPGIGEGTADAIIEYRTQNGPFQSVDELLLVSGIGEGKLEKIRDKIKV